MLADGGAAAASASASFAAMPADGSAAAALARASYAAVLADGGAAAAAASASFAAMLTYSCASAFSAFALLTVVRALLADPRHSVDSSVLVATSVASRFFLLTPSTCSYIASSTTAVLDWPGRCQGGTRRL